MLKNSVTSLLVSAVFSPGSDTSNIIAVFATTILKICHPDYATSINLDLNFVVDISRLRSSLRRDIELEKEEGSYQILKVRK